MNELLQAAYMTQAQTDQLSYLHSALYADLIVVICIFRISLHWLWLPRVRRVCMYLCGKQVKYHFMLVCQCL